MEGRAIARPNTPVMVVDVHGSGVFRPSMEGRAIARPNVHGSSRATIVRWASRRFNGGPGNCPAKPLVRIGAFDLPVCGRSRAVSEA